MTDSAKLRSLIHGGRRRNDEREGPADEREIVNIDQSALGPHKLTSSYPLRALPLPSQPAALSVASRTTRKDDSLRP